MVATAHREILAGESSSWPTVDGGDGTLTSHAEVGLLLCFLKGGFVDLYIWPFRLGIPGPT